MANLLSNLGIHRLLMGCHSIELRGQLGDGRSHGFIGLSLNHYELRHHILQVDRR